MSKTVIRVENLGKKYSIHHERSKRYVALRDVISGEISQIKRKLFRTDLVQDRHEDFWALKDISFEIKQGDRVGIVGRNGAGKSTLLKILSRITEPTTGFIELKGRVSSLLEVGTGFHPELTGRENIFLNGAVLGMSKTEIRHKFDEIVEFAEIENFLDTPVKRYSSGMYVRLAFSVAAHLEPEILIVDEVLAVGDFSFQKKCLGKMQDASYQNERTVLFVSHSMAAVRSLCDVGIFLSSGSIHSFGDIEDTISLYLTEANNTAIEQEVVFERITSKAQIFKLSLTTELHEDRGLDYRNDIQFTVECVFRETARDAYLGVNILNQNQEPIVFWRDFELCPKLLEEPRRGDYTYYFNIPGNTLVPGTYSICLALVDRFEAKHLHVPRETLSFCVEDYTSIRKIKGLPWRGLTAIPMGLEVVQS